MSANEKRVKENAALSHPLGRVTVKIPIGSVEVEGPQTVIKQSQKISGRHLPIAFLDKMKRRSIYAFNL